MTGRDADALRGTPQTNPLDALAVRYLELALAARRRAGGAEGAR